MDPAIVHAEPMDPNARLLDAFRLTDAHAAMVRDLEDRHDTTVARYTTSAFLRLKLGQILTPRVAPHIFETQDEARAFYHRAEAG